MSNNIFYWANKELTMDAVVASLLYYKKTSKSFIKNILKHRLYNNEKNTNIKIIDGSTEVWFHGKKYGETKKDDFSSYIDVLALFRDENNIKHYLIIEDKRDSDIRKNQINDYIEKILKKELEKCHIHFVLLKLGPVYFWQKDNYKKLIKETKSEFDVRKSKKISFYMLENKEFLDVVNRYKDYEELHWITDYLEYLKKEIEQIEKQKNWMNDETKNTEWLKKKVLKKDYNFLISRPTTSRSKNNYTFTIADICGIAAKNKTYSNNEHESFYLLPYLEFCEKEIKLHLNIQLYRNNKDPFGYNSSSNKPEEIRKIAKRIIDKEKSLEYKESKLKLIKTKVYKMKNDEFDFKTIKEDFSKVIKTAELIKKEIIKDKRNHE